MKSKRSGIVRALLCLSGTAAVIGALAAGTASAQRWESTFGGGTCDDYGREGVQPVSTGGYIATGESMSNSPLCQTSDIYVVKTDDAGTPLWQFTYDIGGGNDSATCIRECTNGGGGFIVTGVTTPNNLGCPTASREAFLLRIDASGAVLWLKTYGLSQYDELAVSVIETTTGNGSTTHAGDFVFSGYAWMPAGDRDAYLVRTDGSGNVIWGKTYGGAPGLGDAFMAVTESYSTLFPGPGTLLAAGCTSFDLATMKSQFLLSRIDGNTGAAIKSLQWGGSDRNILYSMDELRIAPYANHVAVAGVTTNRISPSLVNEEIYIAQLPNTLTGIPFTQARYGDRINVPEAAYCIRENRGSRAGNLMVAGYSGFTAAGDIDAFLTELQPSSLNVAAGGIGFKMYGSPFHDEAFSVAQVSNNLPYRTEGFIMAGFSNGVGVTPPAPYQLYMIKTDYAGASACPSVDMHLEAFTPNFVRTSLTLVENSRTQSCERSATPYELTPYVRACYSADGTYYYKINGENDRSDGVAAMTSSESFASNLLSFPNPVTRGTSFTLECTLGRDADVAVSVADMAGRPVYADTRKGSAGHLQLPVSTEGWSAGIYVVKVTVGSDVMMKKIVVSEK